MKLLLVLGLLALVACSPSMELLSPDEFEEVIQDKDVFVLDVHVPEQEHIVGTDAFMPYDQLDTSKLPDKGTPIAVYCRSGSMSAQVAQELYDMGYTVYDLDGGTNAWRAAGKEFQERPLAEVSTMTVYKSPTCGCCGIWTDYVDYDTEVVQMQDLSSVKSQYGVPAELQSCHTAVIGGYVVEGHIPMEAIERMLEERPDIKGIAMPGMPSGSPGMPGPKSGPFVIYAIHNDGSYTEYMRL